MSALNDLQVTVTRIANSGENNFVKNQKIQEAFDEYEQLTSRPVVTFTGDPDGGEFATTVTGDTNALPPLIITGPTGEKGPAEGLGVTGIQIKI